jgi:hypothetical protein
MARPKNPDFEYLPDKRGIPKAHVRITCETCGEQALARADGSRRFCSKSCAVQAQHAAGKSRQLSGSEHYAWKGSEAGYQALHNRVMRARGAARSCEWRQEAACTSTTYEWAHVHQTDPGDPQNYVSLCKACHVRYDQQLGASHWNAKLTTAQAAAIRAVYAAGGVSQEAIAAAYGIDQTTVSKIVRGEAYRL